MLSIGALALAFVLAIAQQRLTALWVFCLAVVAAVAAFAACVSVAAKYSDTRRRDNANA
jgi:hypothetical protein